MKVYNPKGDNEAKILFLGPTGCGKTSILSVYKKEPFPTDYIPTVIDNFVAKETIDYGDGVQKSLYLLVWDSAGQHPLNSVASINFSNVDVVVLCYSVQHQDSFESCQNEWYRQVVNFVPNAAKIVLSMKCDLRDEATAEKDEFVSHDDGQEWATKINAVNFMETSAKRGVNVNECFTMIAKYCLDNIFCDRNPDDNIKRFFCC